MIVEFDQNALQDIFAVKRLVLSMRRHIAPEREVFNILTNRPSALLSPESQIYFRDIYDHVLRINDSIDTYRELLSSVLDSYLTQVSNRLGKITKGLSVVATLSIPFVVISGMWGMNVQHIPLSAHPHAFWWMLGIQLGLGIVLLFILRFWKLSDGALRLHAITVADATRATGGYERKRRPAALGRPKLGEASMPTGPARPDNDLSSVSRSLRGRL